MNNKIIYLLLPLVLIGCSKKTAETSNKSQLSRMLQGLPANVEPVEMTIVETAEAKEVNEISNQANVFLQSKDYDGLDAFVRKLRNSNERAANGRWKFYSVYIGLAVPKEASDGEWTNRFVALQDWINARPDSITARVALANDLVDYAWKARGGDWAYNVTDEGWRLFNQRLNEAAKVLSDAKPLAEKCPYWWSVLLNAELGLSAERSDYDATFKEATQTWPDYSAYYFHRAWYLLPRWYGTEGEWESDLKRSADRIGGDEGDLLYARVVWCMHCSHMFTNVFKENNLSWPRVNKGFEVMEKQFPDSLAAKSEHAYLAALAGDSLVAQKQFALLQGKVDLTVWGTQQRFINLALFAYSHGPKHLLFLTGTQIQH